MADSKMEEIYQKLKRGKFKVILKEAIPRMLMRYLRASCYRSSPPSDIRSDRPAQYVAGGQRDTLKKLVVHFSQSAKPSTVFLILALADMLGLKVWPSEVTQAYRQSTKPLNYDIYISNAAPGFELSDSQALLLFRTL